MLLARFVLADRLNKTQKEIGEMTQQEFNYWFVYLEMTRNNT
jgi:hypothetical protein